MYIHLALLSAYTLVHRMVGVYHNIYTILNF